MSFEEKKSASRVHFLMDSDGVTLAHKRAEMWLTQNTTLFKEMNHALSIINQIVGILREKQLLMDAEQREAAEHQESGAGQRHVRYRDPVASLEALQVILISLAQLTENYLANLTSVRLCKNAQEPIQDG